MVKYIAIALGFLASVLFIFSYQLKARRSIIFVNAASRVLYVLQYILLGAFLGAALDIAAFLVSLLCGLRRRGFVARHTTLLVVLSNAFVALVGFLTYQNVFSLLAILGVVFETSALWLRRERDIRILSLLGAPCWMAYNLAASAYGSALGNIVTIGSIIIALLRYDALKKDRGNKAPKKI